MSFALILGPRILVGGEVDSLGDNGAVEGTDYLVGAPKDYTSPGKLDIDIERFYGGKGYGMRYDMIERVITTELKVTITQRDNIWDYFHRHKDNTTSADYFSWRFGSGANDFVKFFEEDDTKIEYCRGFLVNVVDIWSDSESSLYTMRLKFEEVWS